MKGFRRLLLLTAAVIVALLLSFLATLFGPGPGQDPAPEQPPADGRVLTAGGEPVPGGADVAAILPDGRATTRTGPDGTFRLPTAARGATELLIEAGSVRCRVPRGDEETEVRLPDALDVAGRVVEAATGEPAAGARVVAGDRSVEADARGRFRLPAVPLTGARLPEIRVTAKGYRDLVVPTSSPRAWDDLYLRLRR